MDLLVKYKNIVELIPYVKNTRTHSESQIEQIIKSIDEFGFTNPILIDNKNGIIAGHGRLIAAQKIGIKKIPTIELSGLTGSQKKQYIIADNKLALNSGWDMDLLSLELASLKKLGFDNNIIGFDNGELESILSESIDFNGKDKSGASPWERIGESKNNDVLFTMGAITVKVPLKISEKFEKKVYTYKDICTGVIAILKKGCL